MINPTARSPWVGLQDRVRWLLMRQWDEREFRTSTFLIEGDMTLAFGDDPKAAPVVASPPPAGAHLDIGIHPDVPEARYHSDPCETPSASSSILKTLIDRSPLHAWWDHPRLNPDFEYSASTEAQGNGTILHSMILGTPAPYRVLNFDSFRTNAAKEARDLALLEHKIPILADKIEPLSKVAAALRERIKADFPHIHAALHDPETLFEASVVARIGGVLCRARFDCLPPARHGFTPDLKFTGLSAEPEAWGRKLVNDHMFQAGMYPRTIEATRGDRPEFWFLVCETDAPYGVSLHAMDPQMEDLAARKVNRALALWSECLRTNNWPGYSTQVHYQEPPPWEMARWEGREYRDSRETPGDTYARLSATIDGKPVT